MRLAIITLTLMMTFFNGFIYLFILQKENYSIQRLLGKTYKLILLDLGTFLITFSILIPVWVKLSDSNWRSLLYVISYIPSLALVIYKNAKYYMVNVAFTKRMYRLIIVSALIIIALASLTYIWMSLTSMLVLFIPLALPVVILGEAIIAPFEKLNNQKYIEKAKKTLKKDKLVKIGITGSYGKTSVKEILNKILLKKYEVKATPYNYNTPLGIAKTVSDGVDADIFIAEMGARYSGDISELVDIVSPDIGILTGIAEQHIETFGSIDNIIEEKRKLIDYAKVSIINAENAYIRENAKDKRFIKVSVDSEDFKGDITIANMVCDSYGSSFTIRGNSRELSLRTQLLGKHNIINISLAVAAAFELGVEDSQIVEAVEELEPFSHRQQKLITDRGITIIDDSYNINPEGVKSALDTLSMFDGRKIVTVSGLVETGKREKECNELLGEWISNVADIIVILGDKFKDSIIKGASKNLSNDRLFAVSTMDDCKSLYADMLKQGDKLLILADLPANYII